jgi:hypothetical protein
MRRQDHHLFHSALWRDVCEVRHHVVHGCSRILPGQPHSHNSPKRLCAHQMYVYICACNGNVCTYIDTHTYICTKYMCIRIGLVSIISSLVRFLELMYKRITSRYLRQEQVTMHTHKHRHNGTSIHGRRCDGAPALSRSACPASRTECAARLLRPFAWPACAQVCPTCEHVYARMFAFGTQVHGACICVCIWLCSIHKHLLILVALKDRDACVSARMHG